MKILILQKIIIVLLICFYGSQAEVESTLNEKPLIIQTQARHYEQPTIKEYEECNQNREKCLKVCETDDRIGECKAQCLLCPILIDQNMLIEGINDTLYQGETQVIGNTTNIVRLQNYIYNMVQAYMANITAINENKINIFKNASLTGGKFGVGYNTHGECCYVIRYSGSCDLEGAPRSCREKRHRVCGEKCKAREMYAKKEIECDENMENCKSKINYSIDPPQSSNKCRYSDEWPFVKCPTGVKSSQTFCARCLEIPYGYILHHGLPYQCQQCYGFSMYGPGQLSSMGPYPMFPSYFTPPLSFAPNYGPLVTPNLISYGKELDGDTFQSNLSPNDEWKIVKKKCRADDGSIRDCEDVHNKDFMENSNEEDDGNETPRSILYDRFRRSSYSKRNNV